MFSLSQAFQITALLYNIRSVVAQLPGGELATFCQATIELVKPLRVVNCKSGKSEPLARLTERKPKNPKNKKTKTKTKIKTKTKTRKKKRGKAARIVHLTSDLSNKNYNSKT